MKELKLTGLWMLSIGMLLALAMAVLMLISRTTDPNGVPILPSLLLTVGGGAAVIGLVLVIIGLFIRRLRA
ncbi:putative membrane protein [Arthrobacter pigmenti]|uniref:Putative membrane protein n=1 Tax=Arthrobacter pigmenti TaxID=271432 RepID=A0A846RXU5_9MICC|nr:hypothetical protein [Arthrobacter pigmenti]NJC24385.1 putative membrane protein [Arthrobacter pigmenti]